MEHLDAISALVTGGASGLGEATARALHGRGAHVIIADRNTDRGAALAAELGARAEFCATDVCSEDQVLAAIARAEAARPLRVAVNCAGIGGIARTLDRDGSPHPLEGFRRVLEVNLVGTFNVLRLAAAAMAKHEPVAGGSERGVVINTASVAAFDGQIGQAAYASSKAAIAGMTLPVAR
ncbi:MAG: SDR family NAD(P)-dependent oxidoreductase, partial [Myxococcales bacterium]|nr:SDR family NAD(P)-dependent oxidoreductase [Myxococcales bacterium]